ncbi:uncharacterized protein LOC106470655 [Limulus polyphemus]|uniref:Uncharacterized protein LOC106470655 n=1 Tax=Limulus polyphemus TaxID=6850 RepID=A0ABM1BQF6_LIMPO|nr:uncharacterized protein LOC106470655 [Limulus polyphemus]
MEKALKDSRTRSLNDNHLVITLRTQLEKQNILIFNLRCERDHMIKEILANLFFIEDELKKEQRDILFQLHQRDYVIQETRRELDYWKNLCYEVCQDKSSKQLPAHEMVQQIQENLSTLEKDCVNTCDKVCASQSCKSKKQPLNILLYSSFKPNKVTLTKPQLNKNAITSEDCSSGTDSTPGKHQTAKLDVSGYEKNKRKYVVVTDIGREKENIWNKQRKKILSNYRSAVRMRDIRYKQNFSPFETETTNLPRTLPI